MANFSNIYLSPAEAEARRIRYSLYGISETQHPLWYRMPELQYARALQIWPNEDIPEPPEGHPAMSEDGRSYQLLHVPDSITNLWYKAETPKGYFKESPDRLGVNLEDILEDPNKEPFTKPTWLMFNPDIGNKVNLLSEEPGTVLADIEVFSALLQFPDWIISEDRGHSPLLGGLRLLGMSDEYALMVSPTYSAKGKQISLMSGSSRIGGAIPTVRAI